MVMRVVGSTSARRGLTEALSALGRKAVVSVGYASLAVGLSVPIAGAIVAAGEQPAAAGQSVELTDPSGAIVEVTTYCNSDTNIMTVKLYNKAVGAASLSGRVSVGPHEQAVGNLRGGQLQFLKFPTPDDDLPITVEISDPHMSKTITSDCNENGNVPQPVAGYWMVDDAGNVYAFGLAGEFGRNNDAVDIEPTRASDGFWIVDEDGYVSAFGNAKEILPYRDTNPALRDGEKVTSISGTATGQGYWVFTSEGRVLTYGDAPFLGDMSNTRLNGRVIDSIPTRSGNGYWMVAEDGGVFTFGDAQFVGSTGNLVLNQPVTSLVPDPDGSGYWLVARDGGVFAFDSPFRGSMGGKQLNRPITGMVPFGSGYLMAAEDGGIFNFSGGPFLGSLGDRQLSASVVSVAAWNGA